MTPETTSSNPPSTETVAGTKPNKRSPVERMIVRGLIGILLILALFEARARFGYDLSLPLITKSLEASEKPGGPHFGIDDAEKLLKFWPTKTVKTSGSNLVVIYRWNALFNRFSILLTAEKSDDPNPTVLSFETNTEVSRHSELTQPVPHGPPPDARPSRPGR